jgi:hypothetical protein
MPNPLLYEINTRCWLRELSERFERRVDMGSVPEAEFDYWRRLGISHIWLMGIWTSGKMARRHALREARARRYDQALPDCRPEDVDGSPYAIGDYKVGEMIGREAGLEKFRKQLHDSGLKLILDFVPNHLGLDHPWLRAHPERFVNSSSPMPETFRLRTSLGTRWVAHGKDPHFPAWIDTAQLDYRKEQTRQAMIGVLESISQLCDGVRCDMSMLLLNEVFAATWKEFNASAQMPHTEFWSDAISFVKSAWPDFLFLAEVYWGFEERLQQLGFDFTYDKRLYDHLVSEKPGSVQRHLATKSPGSLEKSVHFLENHDERRAALLLSPPRLRAATWLILSLPGMCLLHEGQLSGARIHCPVQLGRRQSEPFQTGIVQMHEELLEMIKRSQVRKGPAKVLKLLSAPDERANCAEDMVAVLWQSERPNQENFDVSIVNLGCRCRCRLMLPIKGLGEHNWRTSSFVDGRTWFCEGHHLVQNGFELELAENEALLLRFELAPN